MNNTDHKFVSAVFLTFSGNCKEALTYYQTCFGGFLQFKHLEKKLPGYKTAPVVSGSLIAEDIILYGSDMVHNEGRIAGNYIAIFIQCANINTRKALIEKLAPGKNAAAINYNEKLIEITDVFDVRWVLCV